MRIDYLIRAHTAPEQLARLVQRLDGRTRASTCT